MKLDHLPTDYIDKIVEIAIAEDDPGQTMSFEEFRQKHFLSNK